MNILKKTVLAGLMVGVCASFSFADSLILTGEVPAINTVTFTPGMHLSDNLQSTVLNNFAIGTIQIDNNNESGFTLSLSSTNGSKLLSVGAGTTATGNIANYTVTMVSGSGTLGMDQDPDFVAANLVLEPTAGTPTTYVFPVTNIATAARATVAKKYAVTITVNGGAVSDHLFSSDESNEIYKDTITLTIADS